MTWHRVCESSELVDGGLKPAIIAFRDIVVARVSDRLYAFSGLCPHAAAPLHRAGTLDGCRLTCTHHGWQFDLADGGRERYGNRGVTLYDVKEEAGVVLVRV